MHNITTTDNIFTVREPAWHGLGEVLADYPTREEAQQIAHPWEPIEEPVFTREPHIDEDGNLSYTYVEVPGKKALTRDDNKHVLSVNNDTYEPVNNTEMWDVAETVQGSGTDVMYETGGSLLGGRKVWILLRLNEPIKVAGDPNGLTIPYFALQNAHDGTSSFRGQGVSTRIVCDNTSQFADIEALGRGTQFTFSHTKNVADRVEEAKFALAGWRESIAEWQRYHEHLIARRIDNDQRERFVKEFINMPAAKVSDIVRENIERDRSTLRGIFHSPTMEGIGDNAYGLVQAAVEYQNHYRKAKSKETRFKRAYLDNSVVTRDAYDIAMAV